MTTPRPVVSVSLAVAIVLTLALGACVRPPAMAAIDQPPARVEPLLAVTFDNQAREHVHVYLVGQRREWLLGRVEPGAVRTLRIPDGALAGETGFVRLAVIPGGGVTQRAARDARAQLTMAQPTSVLTSQRWRIAQGQLASVALGGPRVVGGP